MIFECETLKVGEGDVVSCEGDWEEVAVRKSD